jgi:transposase-like protein
MPKRKLTDQEVQELKAAYESWNPHDPNSESADALASRFGISKQTLYNYRNQWLEEKQRAQPSASSDEVIQFLVAELMAAKATIAALERRLAELDG